MRVNLSTQNSSFPSPCGGTIPLKLTICPACGIPGDYERPMESGALLGLLRRHTDLPATVIENFERNLGGPVGARLLAVELSETVLTEIGYFID